MSKRLSVDIDKKQDLDKIVKFFKELIFCLIDFNPTKIIIIF